VRLGRPDVDLRTDTHRVLVHRQSPAQRVHIAHPQRGQLSPAQPRVGGEVNESGVLARCRRKSLDLLVAEVPVRLAMLARKVVDSTGRVVRDTAVSDRDVENGCQNPVSADDDRRALRARGLPARADVVPPIRFGGAGRQLRHPGANVAVGDRRHRSRAPSRHDVDAPGVVDRSVARRLQSWSPAPKGD
jgi:hypothetical protein